MILTLFIILAVISIALIVLGLSKPSESAQALIGFVFLFLLAMVVIGGNLEYKTGETFIITNADNVSLAMVFEEYPTIYSGDIDLINYTKEVYRAL